MKNSLVKKVISTILAVLLAGSMLTGCGKSDDTTDTGGMSSADSAQDTSSAEAAAESTGQSSDMVVNMAIGSAWADLIPYNGASGGYYSQLVLGLLYDRLFYLADDGSITSRNADSWEISEDKLSVTFYLNKDAVWSDGTPVTAKDYVYAVKLITDPACTANHKVMYSILAGCDDSGNADNTQLGAEAVDDYTLKYTFKSVISEDVTFPSYLYLYQPIPEHLLSDCAPADYLTNALWSAPVGSGPLVFESTIAGSELVMTSNQNYYLGAPEFAKFKIQVMATSNMASAIIAGDIDFAYPPMGVDDLNSLKGIDGITSVHLDVPTQPYMLFVNQMVYPDVRIRQALDKAIDRDSVAAMLQTAVAVESPILSSTKYYDDTMTYTYDPEAAKTILSEAAADGAIDLSKAVTIYTPSGSREKVANILQQNFQAIGLTVNIQVVEAATMFAGFYDGTTGLGLVNATMSTNPMWLKSLLTNDTATFINTKDDIWDNFYTEFMNASGEDEQISVVKEMQMKWLEEVPIIVYAATYEDYAFNSRLGDKIDMEDIGYGNLPVWNWKIKE